MTTANQQYDAMMMRYLDGQCTDEEAFVLLSWIAESEANQTRFEEFKKVWELTAFPMPDILNVEAALDAVNEKIEAAETHETKTVEMPWLKRNYKYVASLAAALVVALFIGFLVKSSDSTVTMASNDWNAETPYLLPDGTSVAFNGDAQFAYSKHFNENARAVDFEGIAYFDVTKDETKPFVIHCDGVDVEVLGTTFLLNAQKEAEQYYVDLYTGKVRMTTFDQKGKILSTLDLMPGERGVCHVADGQLNVMSYPEVKEEELKKDHVLDFNDVRLATIVETLEYIFEIKIDLPEAYSEEKLTARFTDHDAVDEVLETIATVFGLKVVKTDDTYQIR